MNKPDVNLIREASKKEKLLAIIKLAKDVVEVANRHTSKQVKHETVLDYKDTAACIFGRSETGKLLKPDNLNSVINKVKKAGKLSTLKKQAISVKRVSAHWLSIECKRAEDAISNQKLELAEKILNRRSFRTLLALSQLNPASYQVGWTASEKRSSKKQSIHGLKTNWREELADTLINGDSQFGIPGLALLLTGCRPAEIKIGVTFIRIGNRLRVRIRGAKVTLDAGQKWRCFDIADHPNKQKMLDYMNGQPNPNKVVIRVGNSNSLTTYIRSVAEKLWLKHKHSITAYSIRHAMAADCKKAIKEGAAKDLASEVLGHSVDKTASYYGSLFQSGGISMAPSNVRVTRAVKDKMKQRLNNRKTPGRTKTRHAKKF